MRLLVPYFRVMVVLAVDPCHKGHIPTARTLGKPAIWSKHRCAYLSYSKVSTGDRPLAAFAVFVLALASRQARTMYVSCGC